MWIQPNGVAPVKYIHGPLSFPSLLTYRQCQPCLRYTCWCIRLHLVYSTSPMQWIVNVTMEASGSGKLGNSFGSSSMLSPSS